MAKSSKIVEKSATKFRKHKRTLREELDTADKNGESLLRTFWRGFFLPIKLVGRGLAWITHRPPFKQIGHALKWFFTSTPMKFLAKITGIAYIYHSAQELRSVSWPSLKESTKLTSAVLLFSIVFGLFIAVVDFGLDKLFKQVLLK